MAKCVEGVGMDEFEGREICRSESRGAGVEVTNSVETEVLAFESDETDGTLVLLSRTENFVSSRGQNYHHNVKEIIARYEFSLDKKIFEIFADKLYYVSADALLLLCFVVAVILAIFGTIFSCLEISLV